MTAEEQHHRQLRERFARIRRAKFFLRFMPRRARFHTYPIIGRFADFARKRSFLWSFRSSEVRPAIYVGSVLAFMPVPGLQLALAFALAVLLKRNVMVLAGLQFLTNPLTLPVFIATHKIGMTVIERSGFGRSIEPAETVDMIDHDFSHVPELRAADPAPPAPASQIHHWSSGVGTQINAFIIGGLIFGLVVAAVVDLLWVISVKQAASHRLKVQLRRASTQPPSDSNTSA